MAEETQIAEALKTAANAAEAETGADAVAVTPVEETVKREPKRDQWGRSYGTGRRKDNATARAWVFPGSGKFTVNGKEANAYFARPTHQMIIRQPFTAAGVEGQFDVKATVKGGGHSGQAYAMRMAISRALQEYDPELRPALKAVGYLTRDARIVESKKYGRRKARRGKQWAKR